MVRMIVFTLCRMTAGAALAQAPAAAGNWRSVTSDTFTSPLHPVVTRAELYLNIEVAADGSFRGQWGEYTCGSTIGAYGYIVFPCRASATSGRVSGTFSAGGRGTIDIEKLGRSELTWNTPSATELSIDLPRNWQGGSEALFNRARMTRDGKPRPDPLKADQGPLLSAPAMYREFLKDERGALARYQGRTVALEGRRGTLIQLSDGGAAVHVPDGFQPRALVLVFRNFNEVSTISEGATFSFRCTFDDWAYQYVHLGNCSVVR